MDLNNLPTVQEDDTEEEDYNHQRHLETQGMPDLALNLQAISLSAPSVCSLQAKHME